MSSAEITPEVQFPEDVEMSPVAPRAESASDIEAEEVNHESIMADSPQDEATVPECEIIVDLTPIESPKVSEKSVAVEVVDSFADSVVVLDTNLLVSEEGRRFVDLVRFDTTICARTVFKLPYAVISELDRLKTRKIRGELAEPARRAISVASFLKERLMQGDKRFVIQSAMDDNLKGKIRLENNDDRILNCCLQTMEACAGKKAVYFVTNDVNLQLKARACDISPLKILESPQLVGTLEMMKSFKEQNRAKQHHALLFPARKSV